MRVLRAVAVLVLTCGAAAFEAEEHKLVGDLGSEIAAREVAALFTAGDKALVRIHDGATDTASGDSVRLINTASLKALVERKDRKFEATAFYARERQLEATHPLLVWVGTADRNPNIGGFFTFGDLVALYGDVRRIVTCDVYGPGRCTLTDDPDAFTQARRTALRDLVAGWAVFSKLDFAWAQVIGNHDKDLLQGKNLPESFTAEVLKLAFTNHWHFGHKAVRWYVAMHRQALLLVQKAAVEFAVNNKPDAAEAFFNAALHYEAHGCHSLTDLFATGHMIVDRSDTANAILFDNKQMAAPFNVWQGKLWRSAFGEDRVHPSTPSLRGVQRAWTNELDVSVGDTANLAVRSKAEQSLHERLNKGGARVRNLKRMVQHAAYPQLTPQTVAFSQPHNDIAGDARDGSWVALGDADMSFYGSTDRNALTGSKQRLNPGHAEWVAAAVADSLRALLGAYKELRALNSKEAIAARAEAIAAGAAYYEALADIPLQASNLCLDKKNCFAGNEPGGAAGGAFRYQWLPYAQTVLNALRAPFNMDSVSDSQQLPLCTGHDSTDFSGYCWREPDSMTTATERAAADARRPSPSPVPSPPVPSPISKQKFSDVELAEAGNAGVDAEADHGVDAFARRSASVGRVNAALDAYLQEVVASQQQRDRAQSGAAAAAAVRAEQIPDAATAESHGHGGHATFATWQRASDAILEAAQQEALEAGTPRSPRSSHRGVRVNRRQ